MDTDIEALARLLTRFVDQVSKAGAIAESDFRHSLYGCFAIDSSSILTNSSRLPANLQ